MGFLGRTKMTAKMAECLSEAVEGTIRLWIPGRKEAGPIRLLRIDPETLSHTGECSWVAETVPDGERVLVKDYDIGRKMTPMEVLAWAAK